MINPIWGEDVVFEMKVGVEFIPILCGTFFSLDCDVESVEYTGPTSGGVRQRRRRLEIYTSTVSGLTYVENDDTLSFFYVLQLGVRREPQTFKATFIDGHGDSRTLTGVGVIGPMRISAGVGEFASSDITIWWNEEPEFDAVEDPADECEVVDKIFLTLAEGDSSVTSATLVSKTILGVGREGTGQVLISGTPAAGTRECKYTSGTGTIEFDSTNPGNAGGEKIWVLYK